MIFNDVFRDFIYFRTYSRWLDTEHRREFWHETTDRYRNFFIESVPKSKKKEFAKACDAIKAQEIMGSMRGLWTAGKALERENLCLYNCAALLIDSVKSFSELLYLLMNGTGVGYSVERQYITKLPDIPVLDYSDDTIIFSDSKLGWAEGYNKFLKQLYNGNILNYDLSKLRPKGARLKTFGGRACLTGDTILYKDRKKARGYNEITIRELYDLERSQGRWEHKPNHFKAVKLRSLDEKTGTFFRNNVLHVIDNGVAPVYEILTENGYRIKATDNHRFMNDLGEYQFVSEFNPGEFIAVNGSKDRRTGICIDCGCKIYPSSIRCKSCHDIFQMKDDCLPTTARQRRQCRSYLKESCELCGHDGSSSKLQVHHIDKNPHNNDWDNLQTLCEKCHRVEDAKLSTFGSAYSHKYLSFDKIISIEYAGTERVYDLQMEGPNHNFVANGFVSHNSGGQVLDNLLKFTIQIFKNAQGRKLNSLECNDLCCYIASIIIVGGTRRAACICLSNPSDDRMRHAKDGQFWKTAPYRSLSNISAAYTEKPSSDLFLSEFLNLIRSGSGERGIFNRESCEFTVRQNEYRKSNYSWLSNPCFTGDMRLLTDIGYDSFKKLSKQEFVNTVNEEGDISEGKVWSNGIKPVYEIVLSGKFKNIKCTIDHKFKLIDGSSCLAKDLTGKRLKPFFGIRKIQEEAFNFDDFYAGFLFGDGSLTRLSSKSHLGMEVRIGKNDYDIANLLGLEEGGNYNKYAYDLAVKYGFPSAVTYERELPEKLNITNDFLCGLYSANGSVIESACRISYKTTSKKLSLQICDELKKRKISCYITTNKAHSVKHANGAYVSRESYDINIADVISFMRFAEIIGFGQIYKQERLHSCILKKAPFVKSVRFIGEEEVFDFSEPLTHWGIVEGVVAHNCGERILRPRSLCNLSEVIVRPDDTKETLCRKVRQATILGCVQACYTKFNFVSRDWKKNAEDERLIGVSFTGLRDHKVLNKVSNEAKLWFTEFKQVCIDTALEWSKALEINMPACQTCVKPAGTTSALCGTSSGLHPRFSQYYIRRVRVAAVDPLANLLIDCNVPHKPENGQTIDNVDTWVFEFPMISPEDSVLNSEVNAIEQLEYWLMLKKYWCTGNPSCTIHVDENEWVEVASWVYKHWNYIAGITFLPKSNTVYELMPFEEISETKYNELIKNLPDVDFSLLSKYEETDETQGAQELACSGGSCEIE